MFKSLLRTIQSLVGITTVMEKSVLIKNIDFVFKSINEELLPAFDTIIDSKNLPAVKKNTLFTQIYKDAGIIAKDNYAALDKMRATFKVIYASKSDLERLVEKNIPDIITSREMTAITAAIIGTIKDVAALTSYTLDLLYFIVIDEKMSDLPKIKFKQIREGVPSFVEIYKILGTDFKQLVKDLAKVSPENIGDVKDESLVGMMLSKTGKTLNLPTTQGFINNPIYHFRMWLVDRDIHKYESLKQKKKLIELKVMELKLDSEGTSDDRILKQIKYYEDKLAGIEAKITRIETSK